MATIQAADLIRYAISIFEKDALKRQLPFMSTRSKRKLKYLF